MQTPAKIFLVLSCLLLSLPEAMADVREDIEYLADEVCSGRKTGTNGAVEASWYIISRFKEAGLNPMMESFRQGDVTGHNIICDTGGKGAPILIIAHYDGLGAPGGEICPGADANASGVAGLLWLAEKLGNSGRRIIFAATDGHHLDLAGAKALRSRHREWKLKAVINLDTIGSDLAPVKSYFPEYLIILGAEAMSKGLKERGIKIGMTLYFDYYGSREFTRLFYREMNDQAPFLADGIPSYMFTSGITELNGRKGDTPESINYPLLEKRLLMAEMFIRDFVR